MKLSYANLQETYAIACHVLFFLLRSEVNSFKFILAKISTKLAQPVKYSHLSGRLLQFLKHNVQVVAATCDGASANNLD